MALTQVTDVIVPQVFTPYVQQLTEEKSRLIQSGVVSGSPLLDERLAGGALTFNVPSFRDLANDADNVSTDNAADVQTLAAGAGTTLAAQNDARPQKILTSQEIAVRLNRNQSWSSSDLAGQLAGADPMVAIAGRVADYWVRRLQQIFVQTWNGVIADNAAAPSGGDTHTQNDLIHDASGGSFIDGVTNFTTKNFLSAILTAGDSQEDFNVVMVHSTVYNRMQNNNLIDFIPDARGETQIATFLGRQVIVDDGMPVSGNIYDTWIFGAGSTMLGNGSPMVPTETHREALAGNGGGQEVLTTRREWSMHPVGHAFIQGSIPNGGPSNSDLAAAANWSRRYPERKQIKFARLVTREA